jgi:antirestriction protein ArdC
MLTNLEATMRRDLYLEITNQIVAELKTGVRPWVQRWSETPGLNIPANAVSGRSYSGINTLLLWVARQQDWSQPWFLTYKQALEAGGYVRKGERGSHVVFVKDLLRRGEQEDDKDAPRRVRFLKSYVVFNLAQCDDLPNRLTAPLRGCNPHQRNISIDEFVTATGARVLEHTVECKAYYSHDTDTIVLPPFKVFHGQSHYCNVLFHELVHWTGHASRLNRQLGVRFGERAKAAEELIAEIGASFLCAEFAVDGWEPDTAYIAHYLKLLEDDPKAIFTAASKAQAAVDFLRERILREPTKEVDDV